MAIISRTFVRLGLPYLVRGRKRAPRSRQLKLFEKPNPGDSVQVDVKVVKLSGRKTDQYTAIDDCTRFRVLRLYREFNQRSSVDFLGEVRRALALPDSPAPVRQRVYSRPRSLLHDSDSLGPIQNELDPA